MKAFRCLPIRIKIFFSNIAIGFVVLAVLLLTFSTNQTKLVFDNVNYSAVHSFQQAKKYIEFRISSLKHACYTISYSSSDNVEIFSKDSAQYPINEQVNDLNKLHYSLVQSQLRYPEFVSGIRFYLNDSFIYTSDESSARIKPFSQLDNAEWYKAMLNNKQTLALIPPAFSSEPATISIAHLMSSPSNYSEFVGAVLVDTPESEFTDILINCSTTSGSYCYIVNEAGVLVAASDRTLLQTDILSEANTALEAGGSYTSSDKLLFAQKMSESDWTLVQVIPLSDIKAMQIKSLSISIICALLLLIACFPLSAFVASLLTRRLSTLRSFMSTFRYEHSVALRAQPNGDEIDELFTTYNRLVEEIDSLTEENVQKAKRLNRTELALLQSQLNPHLLFNTLDLIRGRATKEHDDDVAHALGMLSEFYRQSLSGRGMWNSLENELNHIRSYINIQQMRHQIPIRLTIDISESLFQLALPRITLQPLIENSLIHGILPKAPPLGDILISAYQEGSDVLIIIKDNGLGMTPERLNSVLSTGSSTVGIGLSNTNERLMLHFGDGYGLTCRSEEGEYTEIVLRIPLTTLSEVEKGVTGNANTGS